MISDTCPGHLWLKLQQHAKGTYCVLASTQMVGSSPSFCLSLSGKSGLTTPASASTPKTQVMLYSLIYLLYLCARLSLVTQILGHMLPLPLETRVESLDYRLPPHVAVMICYCNCNSYSMSVVSFKDLLCIFDVPILGR